jgi:hypothetical protein
MTCVGCVFLHLHKKESKERDIGAVVHREKIG